VQQPDAPLTTAGHFVTERGTGRVERA